MRIGITTRTDILDHKKRIYLNSSYLSWLKKTGHEVLLICENTPISLILKYCDLLIIAGGYDIHPSFYDGVLDETYTHYDKDIDLFDFTLLDAFVKAHKPVLGICRGIQIINVYFHGTLFLDIDYHMNQEHTIHFHKNAILFHYYSSPIKVNSFHHQAIDKVGDFINIEAISNDGIIEAISYEDFIIGVQWHPELMQQDPILSYFEQYLKNTSK